MLAPSRYHRADANSVTLEFPHLGLHSASASGDIGLVQYALTHGQSVNSVLEGVLPIHAACAGGNDLVVNLLIEHGADVNAARLPRRYSDCNRDATAPIVGTSGSTPLHFAAANGHLTVVHTLLLHGAIPDRADKHGVTPELIARQNGWIECADVLAQCTAVLRQQERVAKGEHTPDSDNASKEHLEASLRKRLHIKRSIDHALGQLRSGTATPDSDRQPPVVAHGLLDQGTAPDSRSGNNSPFSSPVALLESSGRRPSLPHIYDEPPPRPFFSSRTRRPRSAGAGSEQTPPRKPNSKLSLLNLFKKSTADGSASDQRARSPPSGLPLPTLSSPASRPTALPVSPRSIPTPLSSSPRDIPHPDQQRRLTSSTSSPGSGSYPTELHGTLATDVSVSGASLSDDQSGIARPRGRTGIWRVHDWSSSLGHGSVSQPGSSRITRSERSASSMSSPRSRAIQLENSTHPLSISHSSQYDGGYDGIPDTIEESPVVAPHPVPPIIVDHADHNDEEPEEEYGVHILRSSDHLSDLMLSPDHPLAVSSSLPFNINIPPPTDDAVIMSAPTSGSLLENRLRGDSVSSADTTATTSTYPQSSSSDAAWSVATPNTPQISLDPLIATSTGDTEPDSGIVRETAKEQEARDSPTRWTSVPAHIDIPSISSHAQAEELVQLTQQSLLEMEQHLNQHVEKGTETGRTPLSAKLAAYGESLAIQRRLKERACVQALALDKIAKEVDDDEGNGGHALTKGGGRSLLSASKPIKARGSALGQSGGSHTSRESTSLEDHREYASARRTKRSVSDDIRHAQSLRRCPPPPLPSRMMSDILLYTPPRTPDEVSDSEYMVGGTTPSHPLSRAGASPPREPTHVHSSSTISPFFSLPLPAQRSHHHHVRNRDPTRSAQKLSRMGFSTMDAWRHPSSSPLKNRSGSGSGSATPAAPFKS